MSTLSKEISKKIRGLIDSQNLDKLILADIYNIQYTTGIKIPCAHAQKDQIMIALCDANGDVTVILPECWKAVAKQTKFDALLVSYSVDKEPFEAVGELLSKHLDGSGRIGCDNDVISVKLSKLIEKAATIDVTCGKLIAEARAHKTETEIKHIRSISRKTDHAINGYFHHLIADRSKSSMSVSENLRIHSLERDIEIEGYNACSRGVIGESISNIWAYAPKFGFAASDFTEIGDPIIADAMNSERGYWSNSTRIAIMAEDMTEDQEEAYEQLNKLRDLMCRSLKVGKKASEVYKEVSQKAQEDGLKIIPGHSLGFSVGVSPMERPFLADGDDTVLDDQMTFILDGNISHKGKIYRSRDTVLLSSSGVEIMDWYKDWREPYFALNTI